MAKIKVENAEITVVSVQNEDYISLTDMAHSQMQEHIVFRWMSLKSTIEYLGEWEMLYNPNFNCTEFDTIRNSAGSNNFVLSVKAWIERTGAIGIMAKTGRYGGTYAHRDIAYHFGMCDRDQVPVTCNSYSHCKYKKFSLIFQILEHIFEVFRSKLCQGCPLA